MKALAKATYIIIVDCSCDDPLPPSSCACEDLFRFFQFLPDLFSFKATSLLQIVLQVIYKFSDRNEVYQFRTLFSVLCILIVNFNVDADLHRAMVMTAAGEKLLIGRRSVRNWTRSTISSLFLCRKLHDCS